MMKLAVLVLVCAAVAQTRIAVLSGLRGRRFRYFSSPKTWAQAEKFCQSIGANLASVRNRFENRKLLRLIKKKQGRFTPAWIGGSDAQTNGIWFWSDGSNYQYTNWCPKEPNNHNGQQKCLQLNGGSRDEDVEVLLRSDQVRQDKERVHQRDGSCCLC
uniref:C-type lectin domain-containing protein n=1 Tax=Oryzias latipes TaxID=8090 RepID=A0A3P9ID59_ORYLA